MRMVIDTENRKENEMLKIETKTMTRAIEKAKTVHPRVTVISAADRTYSVTGSKGDNYTVKFAVAEGMKLAECDCPARGMCYHIAAAAQVNVMTQSMRQAAPPVSPAPLDTATDRQRRKVDALTLPIRLRGDHYTLATDGADILIETGNKTSRVNPKGRVIWNDNPEFAPMAKPQPPTVFSEGWSI